jgi:hypothetical protein
MVDSTQPTVTKQNDSAQATGINKDATSNSMPQSDISIFRDTQKTILDEISINLSKVDNPKVNAKQQTEILETLLHQLHTAIDEESSKKVQ